MNLKDKVKRLAQENDITIAQLERELNVSQGSINKWDKLCPSSQRLKIVADYFDVSTDYLLGRTSDKQISK